jgi:Flp pilus assembly protein TadD
VRLRPGYAEAHAYLGFALAGSGRYEDALSAYGQALTIGLNNADLHYQMGIALRKLGRMDEARAEFAEATRMEGRR